VAEKMYLAGGGEEEKVEVSSAKIRIFWGGHDGEDEATGRAAGCSAA
jgi:hypothetical protein